MDYLNKQLMKTHGGARKGSGRKPAPYKTKTVSFRVKEEHVESIKKLVKNYLKRQ